MHDKSHNNGNNNGNSNGHNGHGPKAKFINGKVWIPEEGIRGGYRRLAEDDPRYRELFLWLDNNQRFINMFDWVYQRRHQKKPRKLQEEKIPL